MEIRIDVERIDIRPAELRRKIENNDPFWTFAASTWHRLYAPYVPFESGELRDSVTIEPKKITHNAVYAHYMYEGKVYGPNYPISQNGVLVGFYSIPKRPKHPTGADLRYKNPLASARWDQKAAETQTHSLCSSLQDYIDSGRLRL